MFDVKNAINLQVESIKSLEAVVDSEAFNLSIEKIKNLKGKLIFSAIGKSGHVCKKSAATFSSLGISSFFVHPTEASHGDIGMISSEDILFCVSNSGNTKEIFDIINYCKKNNIFIISITKNKESFLGKNSDICVILKTSEMIASLPAPTISTTTTLCLLDLIGCSVCSAKNFSVKDYNLLHPAGSIGDETSEVFKKMQTVNKIDTDDYVEILKFFVKNNDDIVLFNDKFIKKSDLLNNNVAVLHDINEDYVINHDVIIKNLTNGFWFVKKNNEIIGYYVKK